MKTCLHCSDKEGPLAFFVVVVVLPDDQYDSPSFYDLNRKISGGVEGGGLIRGNNPQLHPKRALPCLSAMAPLTVCWLSEGPSHKGSVNH